MKKIIAYIRRKLSVRVSLWVVFFAAIIFTPYKTDNYVYLCAVALRCVVTVIFVYQSTLFQTC